MKSKGTIKAKSKRNNKQIEVKVVGFYSSKTNRVYTRSSDKKRAENNLKNKEINNKLQQLVNKYKK